MGKYGEKGILGKGKDLTNKIGKTVCCTQVTVTQVESTLEEWEKDYTGRFEGRIFG